MKHTTKAWLLGCALACQAMTSSHARFVDNLDTTNSFFGAFGGVIASNTAAGEVTLFKPDPPPGGADAGINWRNGGAGGSDFSLSPAGTESVFVINPVTPVNGGYYNVSILFFSNGNFVTEIGLIPDTNLTDGHTNDISLFAYQNGVNATEWFPRIRVLPFDFDGVDRGFTFTQIAAIPEPTSAMLFAGAVYGLACLFRRRR